MKPKITFGMATFDDFEGVWSTVQSIFLHNEWESPLDVEVIVSDTSPVGSESRELVQNFLKKGGAELTGSRTPHLKYLDLAGHIGTSHPRDILFKAASSDIVCVMDCHVMLPSNALLQLLRWFEANPDCKDLIHGPILYDNLHTLNTHFSDQWRGEMWGTWGNMWQHPTTGEFFACEGEEVTDENKKQRDSDGKVHYYNPYTMLEYVDRTLPSGTVLPELQWAGHERHLLQEKMVEAGRNNSTDPFEIPGMGMGLFACRKDAWLGFNPHCSGFGGEELNIHTKYQQAGHKTLCLPFLKWNHRFGRTGGTPYPMQLIAKVRNYVLWANELNLPLDRIHTHFVKSGKLGEDRWQQLITDPINFKVEFKQRVPNVTGKPLDTLFQEVAQTARDLSQHAEFVKSLSRSVSTVTAFVKRTDWEPMLAAGFPKSLIVYQSELNGLTERTHVSVKAQDTKDSRKIEFYQTHTVTNIDPLEVDSIEPTDLLVIDKLMRGDYLSTVLNKHGDSANKFILIRGTGSFGEKSEFEENSPGLFYAIKDWLSTHPEWFVASHRTMQYGMTVLAKDPVPRPENEIRPWPKGFGPGTELKAMLGSVGINPAPNCDCNGKMRTMDEWGIQGCEDNFDTIVGWLRENAEKWGWMTVVNKKAEADPNSHRFTMAEKVAIGWRSLMSGLAFKVNWADPFPGLVAEAIKRAKDKESAK